MIDYTSELEIGKEKGKEVNKKTPCPICQKPDWCFWIKESEVVICNRTNTGTKIDGWTQIAKSKEGSPIYKEDEAYQEYRNNLLKNTGGKKKQAKKNPPLSPEPKTNWDKPDLQEKRRTKANQAIKKFSLIPKEKPNKDFDPRFPEFSVESPGWETTREEEEEAEKRVYYYYSDSKRIIRKQWSDRRKVYSGGVNKKARSKLILPQHKPLGEKEGKKGEWIKGKGGCSFKIYKEQSALNELEKAGGILWLVGGEQTVEAARAIGLVAICPQGGEGKGTEEIIQFIQSARSRLGESLVKILAIAPDFDMAGINAAIKVQELVQKTFPTIPILLVNPKSIWEKMPLKGDMADWVSHLYQYQAEEKMSQNKIAETIIKSLKESIDAETVGEESSKSEAITPVQVQVPVPVPAPDPAPVKEKKESQKIGKNPSIEELIEWLRSEFNEKIVYNPDQKTWYEYETKAPGCWEKLNKESLHHKVVSRIKEQGVYPNYRKIGIAEQELCGYFLTEKKINNLPSHKIPFQNGIYDLKEKKLLPHNPENMITQSLSYEYDKDAKCPKIQKWLNEATEGSTIKKNILLSFAAASLRKMGQLQFYLELIGAPGTGKGTWLRLMTAFLGRSNTCSTTLKTLENRFELQRLQNARFIQITDAHEFGGDPAILKAITGRDLLRIERKNKDYENDDFYFEGIVIIAANYTPRFSSGHDALSRRRIPILLKKAISPNKALALIEPEGENWVGEFADELPGFFNLIEEISCTEIINILRDESSQKGKNELILDSDPLAQWAVVY